MKTFKMEITVELRGDPVYNVQCALVAALSYYTSPLITVTSLEESDITLKTHHMPPLPVTASVSAVSFCPYSLKSHTSRKISDALYIIYSIYNIIARYCI